MEHIRHLKLLTTSLLLLTGTDAGAKEDRVKIWQYQSEEPLQGRSLDPTILSIQWREGDLEVLFTQAAPCGDWLPVNPNWEVQGYTVTLDYAWAAQFPDAPRASALCKKIVRAWVFRVPKGSYSVSFAKTVPRFQQHEGNVFSLPGRR